MTTYTKLITFAKFERSVNTHDKCGLPIKSAVTGGKNVLMLRLPNWSGGSSCGNGNGGGAGCNGNNGSSSRSAGGGGGVSLVAAAVAVMAV